MTEKAFQIQASFDGTWEPIMELVKIILVLGTSQAVVASVALSLVHIVPCPKNVWEGEYGALHSGRQILLRDDIQ